MQPGVMPPLRARNLPMRLEPRTRRDYEQRVVDMHQHDWVSHHQSESNYHGARRPVMRHAPQSHRRATRDLFHELDLDGDGSLDFGELSVALKAMGFNGNEIKEAMQRGGRLS